MRATNHVSDAKPTADIFRVCGMLPSALNFTSGDLENEPEGDLLPRDSYVASFRVVYYIPNKKTGWNQKELHRSLQEMPKPFNKSLTGSLFYILLGSRIHTDMYIYICIYRHNIIYIYIYIYIHTR